jgi:hypothetical protein
LEFEKQLLDNLVGLHTFSKPVQLKVIGKVGKRAPKGPNLISPTACFKSNATLYPGNWFT